MKDLLLQPPEKVVGGKAVLQALFSSLHFVYILGDIWRMLLGLRAKL